MFFSYLVAVLELKIRTGKPCLGLNCHMEIRPSQGWNLGGGGLFRKLLLFWSTRIFFCALLNRYKDPFRPQGKIQKRPKKIFRRALPLKVRISFIVGQPKADVLKYSTKRGTFGSAGVESAPCQNIFVIFQLRNKATVH